MSRTLAARVRKLEAARRAEGPAGPDDGWSELTTEERRKLEELARLKGLAELVAKGARFGRIFVSAAERAEFEAEARTACDLFGVPWPAGGLVYGWSRAEVLGDESVTETAPSDWTPAPPPEPEPEPAPVAESEPEPMPDIYRAMRRETFRRSTDPPILQRGIFR